MAYTTPKTNLRKIIITFPVYYGFLITFVLHAEMELLFASLY